MTRYQSPMSVWVICSDCGRHLRGQPANHKGWYLVRPHFVSLRSARDVRRDCPGSRRLDHMRVEDAALVSR